MPQPTTKKPKSPNPKKPWTAPAPPPDAPPRPKPVPIPGPRAQRNLITIIGRGHSGTRAISATLHESGVFMGEPLNKSSDLLPPQHFYEACRIMARHVKHLGGLKWDFSKLHTMPIDPNFTRLVEYYLTTVLNSKAKRRGWKLPETTLAFPWIVRLFPNIKYIYWIRDPRDCILGGHITDDLADFGVPYTKTSNLRRRRAISWKYQVELVKSTPKPKHWMTVRLEDFVLDQKRTLRRVGEFLELPLAKIPVNPEAVGRWKLDTGVHDFAFFREDMIEHGYELPPPAKPRGTKR